MLMSFCTGDEEYMLPPFHPVDAQSSTESCRSSLYFICALMNMKEAKQAIPIYNSIL